MKKGNTFASSLWCSFFAFRKFTSIHTPIRIISPHQIPILFSNSSLGQILKASGRESSIRSRSSFRILSKRSRSFSDLYKLLKLNMKFDSPYSRQGVFFYLFNRINLEMLFSKHIVDWLINYERTCAVLAYICRRRFLVCNEDGKLFANIAATSYTLPI